MDALCAGMGGRAEPVCLWKDGVAVTGALVIYDKEVVHVPFASSRLEAFKLNPNNLVYWEIIRRACARGMRTLDFGRSPDGSGALTFKLRWGASPTPQPVFVHTASGKPPNLDVESPSVQTFIRNWKRLPRTAADLLGPWMTGHLLV
jgi:hypothetical protein